MMNEISIYYPQMKSRKMVIQTLIHEYNYLQSPYYLKDITIWDITTMTIHMN